MSTMRIEIQKNEYRGWNCVMITNHPGWPESRTHCGYGTLKSSLWHTVLSCIDLGTRLSSVTVKDKLMPFDEVWEIIHETLADGVLSYRLGDIQELLEVKT